MQQAIGLETSPTVPPFPVLSVAPPALTLPAVMSPFPAFLPSLGGPEMFLIFAVVLLLFGAKKLPQLARGMGKSVGEFRRAKEEFEDEIRRGSEDLDREDEERKKESLVQKAPGTEPRDS